MFSERRDTHPRVPSSDQNIKPVQFPRATVGSLAAIGRILESGLEHRETGRWKGVFELPEAVVRVDELDSFLLLVGAHDGGRRKDVGVEERTYSELQMRCPKGRRRGVTSA